MADWFVDDAATDNTGTGAWDDPLKYMWEPDGSANPGLFNLGTPPAAGDTVYVLTGHSEVFTTDPQPLTNNGTAASPINIIAVTAFNSGSPNTLASKGSCTLGDPTIGFKIRFQDFLYFYGFLFDIGDGFDSADSDPWRFVLEKCIFRQYRSTSVMDQVDARELILIDTDVDFYEGIEFDRGAKFTWRGGTLEALQTGNALLRDFTRGGAVIDIEGVDLSAAGKLVGNFSATAGDSKINILGCKLKSGYTLSDTLPNGFEVLARLSSNGASNKAFEYGQYSGVVVEETTIVRSGGADTGETTGGHAILMQPNTNVSVQSPLKSIDIGPVWVDASSAKTLTLYIGNNSQDLTDALIWADAFYPTDSAGGATWATSKAANWLVNPTTYTDDTGSTWGGAGLTYMQTIDVSVGGSGVGREGYCWMRVYLATDIDVYIDPLIEVT